MIRAPDAPTTTPIAFSCVIGSFRMMADNIIVTMGNIVTTMEASIEEVMDKPTKNGSWLSVSPNTEAKNSSNTSLAGTCSRLKNSDASQNNTIAPEKRKNVSTVGCKTSGINIRATGLLTPKNIFASSKARCPVSFFCSTSFNFEGAKIVIFSS